MTEIIEGYRGVSELRSFFRTDRAPIYFASPTALLAGMEAFCLRILAPGYLRYRGADSSPRTLRQAATTEPGLLAFKTA